MEPPAVTSCSVSQLTGVLGGSSNGIRKRSEMTEYLQIDPFVARGQFEELPENFLDTMSPQQTVSHGHVVHQDPSVVSVASPQLASLTPMSLSDTGGYTTLVSMGAQPSYSTNMKSEPVHEGLSLGSHHSIHTTHASLLEKSFGNGPAGLLSPLHIDSNRCADIGLVSSMARPNGRAAGDMLSSLRRPSYIKEEAIVLDHHSSLAHHTQQQYVESDYLDAQQQQELERMANAETPPAVSNVELASTMIASLIGEPPGTNWGSTRSLSPPPPQQIYHSPNPVLNDMANNRQTSLRVKHDVDDGPISVDDNVASSSTNENVRATPASSNRKSAAPSTPAPSTASTANPRTYSTNDKTDPLNAEIDDDIYIDTKDLCKRIAFELKQHSIPQAIFAERILCRSQGTLSDLLRNPKPWNKLKSGRETFRRMYNWVQQPLHQRLGILDMYKSDGEDGKMYPSSSTVPMMSPPTPAQNVRHYSRNRNQSDDSSQNGSSAPKRPRLVFTDIQKRTLQAIFKETQRPSREMQQTIAEHLRLDISTVANFFMNARRRSRAGINGEDEPAPYQQVRPITPPPVSPPPIATATRSAKKAAAPVYRHDSNHSDQDSPEASSPEEDCEATSPVAALANANSPPQSFEEAAASLADAAVPNGHSSVSPSQEGARSPPQAAREHREPTAEEVKKGALTLSTMHEIPVAGNKIVTVKVERETPLS
uniref:One cut domain family member n=1 Tax=Steinernema glaseri TaxID=37863 RepID=A0A1I7YYE1_9BILA